MICCDKKTLAQAFSQTRFLAPIDVLNFVYIPQVLAGADLENCTLSGCDLQEANLRGANLTDVAFDLILTPLHCSQFER